MKLPTKDEIHPYIMFLNGKSLGIRRVKISNIKGVNRKDVSSKSVAVKEIVKKLRQKKKIYFNTMGTDYISLVKIGKYYFVDGGGNHRILSIKICENILKNKYIMAHVFEYSSNKRDIKKAKDQLIRYLLKNSKIGRYHCKNCDSNFSDKTAKRVSVEFGYTLICPICEGPLI